MKRKRKLGLALGSGGARGWAHVGALLELKQMGIRPEFVAGTSIGSIAGALYATDTVELAADLALNLNWKDIARLFLEMNILRSGLVSGKNFIKLLKDIIPARAFSELSCPLAVVATSLEEEREIIFRNGDLFQAIRASIGIPGIFTPVEHGRFNLVDGGLKNPLPISICRAMGAETVIAIDVNLKMPAAAPAPQMVKPAAEEDDQEKELYTGALENLKRSIANLLPRLQTPISESFERWFETQKRENEPLSLIDVLTRSFRLVENEITRSTLQLNPPDILIQPAVGNITTLEFYRGAEAIEAGRVAVLEKQDQLEKLLNDN